MEKICRFLLKRGKKKSVGVFPPEMLVMLIDSRSEDEQGVNIVISRDIASCIMDTQNSFNNLLSSVKHGRSSWAILKREI